MIKMVKGEWGHSVPSYDSLEEAVNDVNVDIKFVIRKEVKEYGKVL